MFGGYNPTASPPLPDIIGPYYATGYPTTAGLTPSTAAYASDLYGGGLSSGYLYDPTSTTAGIYGSISPIRRRRYSIAGLPSATMMNDYYNMYPSSSAAMFGLQPPLQHASSSNLVNLLNETHKSISRSSQILNQHARMQQTQPLPASHYTGRVISSYPSLHPGGEVSPPYLSDTNLLQMSNSFSSQPNMYFQTYTPASQLNSSRGTLLRPAYSVSNLHAGLPAYTPSRYTAGGVGLGLGSSSGYPYSQSLLNHSDLPYIMQQRQLLSSLHASNPAISQYYQQQLPHYLQHYAQQPNTQNTGTLAYNLQQQFAGTQHYPLGGSSLHPAAHIHHSVAQQLNPNHQFHVHAQQNHLQTHPLAGLGNSSAPFGVQLTSSDVRHDNLAYHQAAAAAAAAAAQPTVNQAPPPTHHHHHPHIHHPTAPHMHHIPSMTSHHHHATHHHSPYTKIDLDYPKLQQEHKRQVSFKFDVDQLSLDS